MFFKSSYLKTITATIILLSMLLGLQGTVSADLTSSYHVLKNQYPEFIDRLVAGGATEMQIETFINALNTEAQARGPLTETNFDSVLFVSLQSVLTRRAHRTVLIALMSEFGDEIDYTLATYSLHPSLVPLRRAVWESLFGDGDQVPLEENEKDPKSEQKPSGTVMPPTSTVSEAVQRQLDEGRDKIRLSVEEGKNYLSLTAEDLQAISAAGKELEVEIGRVCFTLPPGAADINSGNKLILSARAITDAERQKVLANAPAGSILVGSVFEFSAGTEDSVFGFTFSKPIKVTLSYAGEDIDGVEEDLLDIYYYNESEQKWIPQKGILDKENKSITFATNSFSKYAIMYDAKTGTEPLEEENQKDALVFTDLAGHWAKADVEEMFRLGLVKGVSAIEFAPNRNITRAEFATLLVQAVGLKNGEAGDASYTDVKPDKWYYDIVNLAAKANLVSGYGDRFGPDDPVTREQMAVMITRALAYKEKGVQLAEGEAADLLNAFQDKENISSWAGDGVAAAVKAEIVKGRSAGEFAPRATATRAEAAVMILRMYRKF